MLIGSPWNIFSQGKMDFFQENPFALGRTKNHPTKKRVKLWWLAKPFLAFLRKSALVLEENIFPEKGKPFRRPRLENKNLRKILVFLQPFQNQFFPENIVGCTSPEKTMVSYKKWLQQNYLFCIRKTRKPAFFPAIIVPKHVSCLLLRCSWTFYF